MAFDPNTIKRPIITPDNLPEDASRDERILALANLLQERGLTSGLAAAKRLAEGMVDVERKVISQNTEKGDPRKAFQREDSQLFKAVGGIATPELRLPVDFADFVQRAASMERPIPQKTPELKRPEPVTYGRGDEKHQVPELPPSRKQKQVIFDEVPATTEFRGIPAEDHWTPDPKEEEGYSKTEIETTEDGVVVRKVETTHDTHTVEEEGIIAVDEPDEKSAEPQKESSEKDDSNNVSLFDVFNTNK